MVHEAGAPPLKLIEKLKGTDSPLVIITNPFGPPLPI